MPLRTAVFLGLTALFFDASYRPLGRVAGARSVLLAFIPFVWGLGVISAAATLTFRRGAGGVGFIVSIATIGSGAYFPLTVCSPCGSRSCAQYNPVAIAVHGDARRAPRVVRPCRRVAGGRAADPDGGGRAPRGAIAFRAAVQRERRKGTLGLY